MIITIKKIKFTNETIEQIIPKGKNFVYYFYRNLLNTLELTETNYCLISAVFIFINKTCFRGLYRENKLGIFNVPFGNYTNPSIYDEQNLLNLNKLFNSLNIIFQSLPFDFMVNINFNKNDFVYFDPPYYPIKNLSFTSYNKTLFEHNNLYKLCLSLNQNNIKFIQTNSCCSFNLELYKNFKIIEIQMKRKINSKKPNSFASEIIISN